MLVYPARRQSLTGTRLHRITPPSGGGARFAGNPTTKGISMKFMSFAAVAAALTASPLSAQTNTAATGTPDPTPGVAASDDDSDVITVTARRRDEAVQDIPLAVSVIDSTALTNTGSYNIGRLVQLQPSVQFFTSNPRNSAIVIRGLGAPFGLTNDGIEQGVGLYIDQVYYSRPAAASFDLVDVDRIEVLRGPQGTLYGKNTTAGALNITTAAPSFRTQARFEITGGNYDFLQAKASVTGPITDRLAARIAFSGTSRRGTLHNVTTGADVNEQRNIGVRASLLWRATDTLDLTLSADFSRQDTECCAQAYVRVAPTLRAANRQYPALAAQFGYAPPSTDPFDRLIDADSDLQARQNFGGASLLAQWELGSGTLTSITAWRFWDWRPQNDRDFISLPITTRSANASNQRQLTQEVRYASDYDGPLNFVAGAFAYRQTINTLGIQEQGAAASGWLLAPSANATPALLDGYRQTTVIAFTNNSLALFGRGTWAITPRLTIEGGLRLNYDDKAADYSAVVSGGLANPTAAQRALQLSILAPQAYSVAFNDTNISGDGTLSWRPVDDVLIYATYAKSFKSGGVNLSGLPNDAAGNPALSAATVRPENVDHFEAGLKSQWASRRITFNLAIYRTDVHDYQATVVNGQLGVLRGYLANVDLVRVQGVEADLRVEPTERLNLYANAAFTDARYIRFPDAPPPIELTGGPQSVDISGQRLPGVSKWSAAFGGQWTVPVTANGDRRIYLGADITYRSSFSSNPTPSAYTNVDGYTISNFRLGYETDSGWNAFAWVRNAFDSNYFDFLSIQPGNSGLIVGQPGDPRTFGVTLARKF